MNNIRRSAVSALMIMALGQIAYAVDVDNPPQGQFIDEWYAIMIRGKKSGHMHSTMERIKTPGGDIIKTYSKMYMTMARGQARISVTLTKTAEETLTGKPLAFTSSMKLGNMETTKKGTIDKGKIHVTMKQYTQEMKHTYNLPEGAMMEWALYREQIKRGLKPGTTYELKAYDPSIDLNSTIPTKVEILDEETIDLFGRKVQTVKAKTSANITSPFSGQMEVVANLWFNHQGDVLRMQMDVMNNPVEMLACTKTVALAKDDPAEMMIKSFILADKAIDAQKVTQVTYRLEFKNPAKNDTLENIPETGSQKIVNKSKNQATITVTKQSVLKLTGSKKKLSPADRKLFLAPTSTMNYKDPAVAKLAKQAAGDEKDPRKLADRLRKFVSEYVQDKNLNVGFATASEVARSKQGDCTEHGVLLAALGRALGIPTRTVMGVAYIDQFMGRQNVFCGHLWTQFWIKGQWVDLDPALKQTDVEPTHIALMTSSPGDAGIADLVCSIFLSLHKLKISVVEVK